MARFWVRRSCSSLLLKRIVFAMRVSTRKRSASWALRHWQDRACSRVPPLYRDRAVRTVRHQSQDRLQTSGALRRTRFGGLAAAQPPAAPLAAAHRRSGRGTHSRGAPSKENCLPTPTGSPPPPRANRSSGRSPRPDDRATPPPTHRSRPEKFLKRLAP